MFKLLYDIVFRSCTFDRKMMLAGQKPAHPKLDVLWPIETNAFVYLSVSVVERIAIKNF